MRTDKVVRAPMLNHQTNVRTVCLLSPYALKLTLTEVDRPVKKLKPGIKTTHVEVTRGRFGTRDGERSSRFRLHCSPWQALELQWICW
jgi:hypothetical protein